MVKSSTKHVAIIARNISGSTGSSNIILHNAIWLANNEWKVSLIGSRAPEKMPQHESITFCKIPDIKIGSYLKRRIFSYFAEKLTKTNNYIIHGHGDTLNQDILSLHNCVHKTYEMINKKPLPESSGVGKMHSIQLVQKRFKHLIANSNLMKNDITARFGIKDSDITVIYPGYDPGRFNTADSEKCRSRIEAMYSIPKNSFIIGFLSSGDFEKRNLKILLQSISRLKKTFQQPILCIVAGYDKNIPRYKAISKELGIGDLVIFAGKQQFPEQLFKAFDIYVHPAHFEEFGLTVLEALACGIPTITTSSTGASELIKGDARFLVMEGNPDSEKLSGLIAELLKNHTLRKKISASLPAMAGSSTWDHNCSSLNEIYTRTLISKYSG